jgi:hypothetical protein
VKCERARGMYFGGGREGCLGRLVTRLKKIGIQGENGRAQKWGREEEDLQSGRGKGIMYADFQFRGGID